MRRFRPTLSQQTAFGVDGWEIFVPLANQTASLQYMH
jgi:hypothetical protein